MKTYWFKNLDTNEITEVQAKSWHNAESAMGISNEWPQSVLKLRIYRDFTATMNKDLAENYLKVGA